MKRFAAVLLATMFAGAMLPSTSPADAPPTTASMVNKRPKLPDATPASDQVAATHPSGGTANPYAAQFTQKIPHALAPPAPPRPIKFPPYYS